MCVKETRRLAIEADRLAKLSRRHSSIQVISEAAGVCPAMGGGFVEEKMMAAGERRRGIESDRIARVVEKREHAVMVRKRKSRGGSSVEDLVKLE
jgi:hypothetical protein